MYGAGFGSVNSGYLTEKVTVRFLSLSAVSVAFSTFISLKVIFQSVPEGVLCLNLTLTFRLSVAVVVTSFCLGLPVTPVQL